MDESIEHRFLRKMSKNNNSAHHHKDIFSGFGSNFSLIVNNNVNNTPTVHHSSRINKNFFTEVDTTLLELLYKNHINNSKLVEKLNKVKDCSIFKYGVNQSFEDIPYSFCKTCDKSLIKPICESCLFKCHKGHKIVLNIKKGKIRCSCGEKLHIVKKILDKDIDYCIFNEWTNLSKLNKKYKNKNKQLVCIFCYYICNESYITEYKIRKSFDKTLTNTTITERDNKCYCTESITHNDFKEILSKLLELFSDKKNAFKNLINPTQTINMIFRSRESFRVIFSDFHNFFNFKDNNSINVNFLNENFIKTNFYLSLKIFMKIFKDSNLSYYCQDIEKYFSFNNLKMLLSSLQKLNINEKTYFMFIKEFLFLFWKAYIEKKICNFFGLNKICDLENLSCIQRSFLFRVKEKNRFIESSDIILVLARTLKNFEINTNISFEVIEYLKNIIFIFKKLSALNLIKINEMIQICKYVELTIKKLSIYKSANISKKTDDIYSMELKLLNNILKMMIFFIYHNNDKIIYDIIMDEERYSSIKNITQDKICFTLTKSNIGNSINKLAIRILFILQKYYAERDKTKLYRKTCNNAIKILNFSLISDDNYMINIIQSLKFIQRNPSFFHIIKTSEYNKYYQSIINSKNIIEKGYYEYLNFIIDEDQLIDLMDKSLDIVFGDTITEKQLEKNIDELNVKFSDEKNLAIIDSQYFFSISKIFIILFQDKLTYKESNEKMILVKKILYLYFLFINKSAENSLLVLSSPILEKITKIPRKCSLLLFKLLYNSFNNIFLYDGFIIKFTYAIKKIYGYLEKVLLFDDDDDFDDIYEKDLGECVYYFMQILKTIVYDIKLTYKCDDFIKLIKNIISNINLKFKLPIKYFKHKIDEHKIKSNGILTLQENIDEKVNLIYKSFLIYIKLINDFFDFSLENERKIISRIINIDILIFGLSNFVLNLDERSEYIRFIRKMILDINYCEKKEHLYTSFIINNKDYLSFIKNNPLIQNLKYPTQLLSFKRDFYKISEMIIKQEKNNRKKDREQIFQLLSKNIINFLSKDTRRSKIICSSKSVYKIILNGSKDILMRRKSMFSSTKVPSCYRLSQSNVKNYDKNRSSNLMPVINQNNKENKEIRKSANYLNVSFINKLNSINQNNNINFNSLIDNENNVELNQSISNLYDINNISISGNIKSNIYKSTKNILKKEKEEFKSQYFDSEFHLVLLNELEFINYYSINIKIDTKEKIEELRNYFENSLLIPIIYYFKRVSIFINLYTGYEIEKIYTLLIKCINLKKKISRYNIDFWGKYHNDSNEDEGEFNNINYNIDYKNIRNIYKNKTCIDGRCFIDPKLIKETNSSLNVFAKNRCSFYDFTKLYQIIQKEFFNLVKNGKKYSILKLFKENTYEHHFRTKDDYFFMIQEMIDKEEKKILNYDKTTILEKKLTRIFLIYKYNKFFFSKDYNNLSLFDIFQEACIEFQCNYLNLLIIFLVNCGRCNDDNELFNMKYYLLFILLTYFPNEVQLRIKEIIEKKDSGNLGFMIELSQKLFQKLILFFIDYFNPQDRFFCSRHLIVFNLIKIFKYLCENYNPFFQHHLMKSLKYVYNKYIPRRYEVKHIKNNVSTFLHRSSGAANSSESSNHDMPISEISNSSIINYNFANLKSDITFKDFYFCVLLKILFIPGMFDKKNGTSPCLYFLFKNILEMLTLIIQGNKMELTEHFKTTKVNLNVSKDTGIKIKINRVNSSKKSSRSSSNSSSSSSFSCETKSKNMDNYKLIETGEPFTLLIERTIEILFEKENICLSYDLKLIFVNFILSVLEERNIRQEIKSTLLRKLNIQTILRNIGKLLKKYYYNHQENKQLKNLEKLKEVNNNVNNKVNTNVNININKVNEKPNIIDKNENFKGELIIKELTNHLHKIRITSNTNLKSLNTSSQLPLENNIPSLIIKKNNKKLTQKKISDKNKKNESIEKKIIPQIKVLSMNKNINNHTKKTIFNEKLCDYFKTQFFKINKDFLNSKEFILANLLYKCVKVSSIVHKKPEAEQLIKKTKRLSKIFNSKINGESNISDYLNSNIYNDKYEISPINSLDIFNKKRKTLTRNLFSSPSKNWIEVKTRDFTHLKNSLIASDNNIEEKENNNIHNNDINNNEIEQFYIIQFFETITSTVEIRTKERLKHISVFTKLPEMKYLSEDGKSDFLEKVNRDSENNKKNELIKYLSQFIYEINYYKHNKNIFIKWFSKRKLLYYRLLSFIFAIIINFITLFNYRGNYIISAQNTLTKRRENKLIDFYKNSLNDWLKYYNVLVVFYIILNIYLVTTWMIFRFPLYYKLDEIKYIEFLKLKRKLKLKEKIYVIIFMTITKRTYIYSVLFQLIISILSFFFKNQILSTLLLFPIMKLSKTLKSLINSIILGFDSLCLILLLATIIMYMFSNIAFFFFKPDYEQTINSISDNVCDSLMFCFLNAIDSGLRARGGIGDSGKKISYLRNNSHYLSRTIMDVLFFMMIVIIAVDMIFAITVENFGTLQNKVLKDRIDREENCFICHIKKKTLNSHSFEPFDEHRNNTHYIWKYVEYMLSLLKKNTNKLNYLDTYVKIQIKNKKIDWFPTYKDLLNDDNNNDKCIDENEEPEILVEHVANYKKLLSLDTV